MYLVALIIVITLIFIYYRTKNPSRLPPGPPWQVPILGHLPFLGHHLCKSLLTLKKKYGTIVSLKFGSYNVVALSDAKLIREACSNLALCGRPRIHFMYAASKGNGMIYGNGPKLYEQRQFILRGMKDFGFRSKAMEDLIHEDISELLQKFKLEEGKIFTVHNTFAMSVVNSFWACIMGRRFPYGDMKLAELVSITDKIFQIPNSFELLCFYVPFLSKLMPNLSGFNVGLESFRTLYKFMEDQIKESCETRIKNHPTNLTEAYLDKVEQTTDENSSFFEKQNYQHFILGDLLLGAADTTSTFLEWTLAYLSQFDDIQRRLQKEIMEVVGDSRVPSLSDRQRMPYTEAVIAETLRFAAIAPIGVMHSAMEDTILSNFLIPKDTVVFTNIYALSHDAEVWGDPEVFRPERFIDADGKFKKIVDPLPFGTGKRVCPGETIARDQIFLYTTSIFQKFNVNYSGAPANLEGKFGIVVKPEPFKVIFSGRSEASN